MAFASRDLYQWQLRTRRLELGKRTLIMGVLNVTPDSFSDGNLFLSPEAATAQALAMLNEGADIIDIGGESTRPGQYEQVPAEEEQQRVLPVLAAILQERPSAVISIDTYKAATARLAVEAGAEIVNDISAFGWDEAMTSTCVDLKCGVVLMHTRGRSAEWRSLLGLHHDEVLPLVKHELAASLKMALDSGVERSRIALDPGYGFGKSFDENYPLLARQNELSSLGQPLLAGVSRKSFLGRKLADLHGGSDAPMEARANATIAASVAAILAGAHMIRVHEVEPAVEAARIADAVLAAV
ncbi:dihydropteroate synthase [Silvibacterium bohemicum]|uniref:dihydropteroate synthase n=1 Tax=Silvibacterium bohemicum TaxID=1577686 RepID=A0A841K105_9BACT|nr:dihydropteroate synthase [Silvibacterium bohemicum]MBB6146277.1 dihydropteroate synthase [Silvibacterium bohemicum]